MGLLLLLLVPVGELLSEPLLLPELLGVRLTEAELLGLAPLVREAVLLPLRVELLLRVEEGVGLAVPVPLLLPVARLLPLPGARAPFAPLRPPAEALALPELEWLSLPLALTLLLLLTLPLGLPEELALGLAA